MTLAPPRTEPFRAVTADWLARHGVRYYNLILTENKLQACDDLRIDVLIDDAPHYAERFAAADKPFILYDQPYNRHIAHERIRRAADWNEIGGHLTQIESHL